jgi:hypothetical protein
MTLPQNDATKQFIIEHWAAIQPKDIAANWNPSAVVFEGDDALVTCNSPVPPTPRIVRVPLARVQAWAAQMGYGVIDAPVVIDYTPPSPEDDDTDTGEDEAPVKKATSKKK